VRTNRIFSWTSLFAIGSETSANRSSYRRKFFIAYNYFPSHNAGQGVAPSLLLAHRADGTGESE
jgi:hypothetical protein